MHGMLRASGEKVLCHTNIDVDNLLMNIPAFLAFYC